MATLEREAPPALPPAIRRQLDSLRARIRGYVWLEGLAATAVWVTAAFWGSMALDWGAWHILSFDLPQALRAVGTGCRGGRAGSGALLVHPPSGIRPPERRQHGHGAGTAVPAA